MHIRMTDIDFMFLAFSPCYSSNDFLIDVYCALHHVKSIKNSFNLPGSCTWGFSGGSVVKSLLVNAGDMGSIPGSKDFLEKEMATHSSTVAWRIPWTKEPDGLQSMELQKVGHD